MRGGFESLKEFEETNFKCCLSFKAHRKFQEQLWLLNFYYIVFDATWFLAYICAGFYGFLTML